VNSSLYYIFLYTAGTSLGSVYLSVGAWLSLLVGLIYILSYLLVLIICNDWWCHCFFGSGNSICLIWYKCLINLEVISMVVGLLNINLICFRIFLHLVLLVSWLKIRLQSKWPIHNGPWSSLTIRIISISGHSCVSCSRKVAHWCIGVGANMTVDQRIISFHRMILCILIELRFWIELFFTVILVER